MANTSHKPKLPKKGAPKHRTPAMAAAPTMQEVAAALGLSRAAVSMGLSGDRSIPEATRRRIRETAERMGYRPNLLVASLMSMHRRRRSANRVRTCIAFLSDHPRERSWRVNPHYREMFAGAQERAAEVDCVIEAFELRAPGMSPARLRGVLDARGIHGVVVAPLAGGAISIDFDFTNLIAVGVGMSLSRPLLERVSNDHFQSCALAVRKCAELGYRRIGFVLSEDISVRLDHRWLGGYVSQILRTKGAAKLPPLLLPNQKDHGLLVAWLRSYRPEVVIMGDFDAKLIALLPPEVGLVQLNVASIDGSDTGVFQNSRVIGRKVAERVIGLLYTNDFSRPADPVLHLVGGGWAAGKTAPGPGLARGAA